MRSTQDEQATARVESDFLIDSDFDFGKRFGGVSKRFLADVGAMAHGRALNRPIVAKTTASK